MRPIWIAGLALAAAAVAAGAVALGLGRSAARQPIAFNHRLHAEELGMECVDCHLHAVGGERATIPNVAVCIDCHEEAQTESPEEARLVERIASGEPIPWLRVYWVPSDVYFSHRRHTAVAGIECSTCHGPVAELERPLTRPLIDLTMDDCIDCHRESGVTNDCISCHR